MADGERMCLPPMWPWFESFTWHHKCSCLVLWVLFLVLRCFSSHESRTMGGVTLSSNAQTDLGEGLKGSHTPLFSRIFKMFYHLQYEFALKIASRIRPHCCMLHGLESKVFIHGEEGGGLSPLFLHFLDLTLQCVTKFMYLFILFM